MVKQTKGVLAAILLSCVAVLASVNWLYTGDPTKFFLLTHSLEGRSDNVDSVDVEFIDRKVYLNVHVKSPTGCKKIITSLGINNILIGNRIFKPTCEVVNKKLIRILYSEVDAT